MEQIDATKFNENYEELINPVFSDQTYDDSLWESMNIPTWLKGDLKSFDGAIWFRKSLELSDVDENTSYDISLGGIDDEDITFVNGVKVGATKNWSIHRNYPLPKGLLKNGGNPISVHLFDGASNGGMYGGKDIGIRKDDLIIKNLSGDWKYLPTAILRSNKVFVFTVDKNFKAMPLAPLENNSHLPTGIYNAMIHPIVPYSIKGAIWYQGESNVSSAEQYKTLFPAMIQSWRNKWGKEFPFYFTQIAPFNYSGASRTESAELRFSQNLTLSLPHTGQAVTLDIGNLESIHPPNKKEVGERLARWALAKDYEQKSVAFSGPVCTAAKVNSDKIVLDFNIGVKSLIVGKLELKEFELEFENGVVKEALARIEGSQIIIDNPTEQLPIAVRYAWKNSSEASLFNSAGLPASTFLVEIE